MENYCLAADVKKLAGAALATDDTLLATLVARASRIVDKYTGRVFVAASATRYYTPGVDTNANTLYLDADLLSVTTLTVNGTVIPAAGFVLHPLNATAKTFLRLKSAYDFECPDDPEGAISIAGSWGYSATPPDDVVQATARLALWLYRQREAPFSRVGNAITGEYEMPVALPDDVRALLDGYRRLAWGFA